MSPDQLPAMAAMLRSLRDRLSAADVHFTEATYRDDAVSLLVNEPGEYWEIDVLQDGSVDVEIYVSQGLSDDPMAAIDSLIQRKSHDTNPERI